MISSCKDLRAKEPSEKEIQNSILAFLQFQKDLVAIQIDNGGVFDVRRGQFRKKRPNRGSCFFTGIPDLIVFHKTLGALLIEVKSKKGTQSDDQKMFQASVENMGFRYFVVRSLEDVQEVLSGN